MTIQVVSGNITQFPADVLVTFVNPYGVWRGGVDRAIQAISPHYHRSLKHRLNERPGNLPNTAKYLVEGDSEMHGGEFKDVLFVVDDVDHPAPIDALVSTALFYAASIRAETISIPVPRTGQAARFFPDVNGTVLQFVRGVLEFSVLYPEVEVSIVVYDDDDMKTFLELCLGL